MKVLSSGIIYLKMIKSRLKNRNADPYHVAGFVGREELFVFH